MKKLVCLIAAGVVFFGVKLYAGESVSAPYGETSNPINADYGGVDYSTSMFNANVTTVVPISPASGGLNYSGFFASTSPFNNRNRYRVYGANFSTGTCGDSIAIYTSTGVFNTLPNTNNTKDGLMRIYNNISASSGTASAPASICGGTTYWRWPVRFYGNLFFQVSNSAYNGVQLLYWKEPD